jgi:hypothetical protein
MDSVTAFPLHWPAHRKRTTNPARANFHRKSMGEHGYRSKEKLTIADSRDRLYRELGSMNATGVVISSNLQLKIDGQPRSGQSEPRDSGVAVYFQLSKHPHCLSCDKWDRCADNLAAIAKHVEAMRGQLRWGVADVASMFAGFKALPDAIITPAPMSETQAALAVSSLAGEGWRGNTLSDRYAFDQFFSELYRKAAKKFHPDANSGQHLEEWDLLQRAADILKKHHGIA